MALGKDEAGRQTPQQLLYWPSVCTRIGGRVRGDREMCGSRNLRERRNEICQRGESLGDILDVTDGLVRSPRGRDWVVLSSNS